MSTAVAEGNTGNGELEEYRRNVRAMELKVMRKEADLRLAEEERMLRDELQDLNEMIVDKLKNDELMESRRLPLDEDHREEIKRLEDLLRMERAKADQLESDIGTMESQIMTVEDELEKTSLKLLRVKDATGWDDDVVMAKEGRANLNEFLEKKKILTALRKEQDTNTELSYRLTSEIDELLAFLADQEDLEQKISAAKELLAEEKAKYNAMCVEEKNLEALLKKKERQVTGPKDEYKEIRQLEREKRTAHELLQAARENTEDTTKSLSSSGFRLRQLEGKLETINIFLQRHFGSLSDLPSLEGVSDDAESVSVGRFNYICRQIAEHRTANDEKSDALMEHDKTIEQLQLKINVLRYASVSNNVSSQLFFQQQEKDLDTLVSHLENLNTECEEVEQKVEQENKKLRRELLK